MDYPEAIKVISKFVTSSSLASRHLAIQFLTVFSHLRPPETHRRLLEALNAGNGSPLKKISEMIAKDFDNDEASEYLCDLVLFVNAIVEGATNLRTRMHLRMMLVSSQTRKSFSSQADPGLKKQIERFEVSFRCDAEKLAEERHAALLLLKDTNAVELAQQQDTEALRELLRSFLVIEDQVSHVRLLQKVLNQAILISQGFNLDCTLLPALNYNELLRACQQTSHAEKQLHLLQAESMRKQLESDTERKALNRRIEDFQSRVRYLEKECQEKDELVKSLEVAREQLRVRAEEVEMRALKAEQKNKMQSVQLKSEESRLEETKTSAQVTEISSANLGVLNRAGIPPPPPAPLGIPPQIPQGAPLPPPPPKGIPAPPGAIASKNTPTPTYNPTKIPKRKLKPMQWTKLVCPLQGTIWQNLDPLSWESRIDLNSLEILFAADTRQKQEKKGEEGHVVHRFVSYNASLAISLILKPQNTGMLTPEQLLDAMQSVDYQLLSEDLVDKLMQCRFSPEEQSKAMQLVDLKDAKVGLAEKYLVEVQRRDPIGYWGILSAYHLRYTFAGWLRGIEQVNTNCFRTLAWLASF